MAQITPDKLAELRRRYTKGSRVKLIHMNDPYRPDLREGALGTVTAVDDIGTIHVAWDCGSSLGVVYGEDFCTVMGLKERIDDERASSASCCRIHEAERFPASRREAAEYPASLSFLQAFAYAGKYQLLIGPGVGNPHP